MMTATGTLYGVVLNDRQERDRLAEQFDRLPYAAPPLAPVAYIKPRGCLSQRPIVLPAGVAVLRAAATLALLFRRDAAQVDTVRALDTVGAAALALDFSTPNESYYRPDIKQRCRDGFLHLGSVSAPSIPRAIDTFVDGVLAHSFDLDRLLRPAATLIADLSAFMTLRAGDLLLIGLAGDAPLVGPGQQLMVKAEGFAPMEAVIAGSQQ